MIYSPSGQLINKHEPYKIELGVLSFSAAFDGFLAVAFFDEKIRILSSFNWKIIDEVTLNSQLQESTVVT